MHVVIVLMVFQTIVFMTTLLVLAFQERQQVKALRFDAYARCQADYCTLIRMLAENQSLHSIYDTMIEASPGRWKWEKYDPKEKQVYNFLELNLELLERVYVLRHERWIDEETWQHWDAWLQDLASVPLLEDVWRDNAGMFDSLFMRRVRELLGPPRAQPQILDRRARDAAQQRGGPDRP